VDYETFSYKSITHICTYVIVVLYVPVATHGHSPSLLICLQMSAWLKHSRDSISGNNKGDKY
jgi:hypothetical protein